MSGTIQQSQTNLFSINKRNIDLRIEKKQFDIHTEDFTCVIDEVEFVKIIDITTQTPLPVVEATQPKTTLLPRKGVSKFFSRLWNRLTVLPLTMPLCLVLILGLFAGNGWGQSYLGLDGGLEGTATVAATFSAAAPSAGNGKWTTAGSSSSQSAIALESTTVRSGSKSLKISGSSTTLARVWTPCFTIPSTTSKFFVQYYRRSASTTNSQQSQLGNLRGGTEQANGTYATVTASNTWEKVSYAPTTITSVTSIAGVLINKAIGTGGDFFVDDFVIYAATAVDNTAPSAPTSPLIVSATSSSLNVSWSAASGGVDGGGYLVVRHTADPTTAPNVNGIYAVNNTIGSGTVVYQGTNNSFTDNSLASGTTYYYRIYTYDKAYNYSSAATVNGTTSVPTPTITGAATATAFSTTYGTASVAQSFSISGSNLTANLVATAPTGFEVSSDGTSYGSTATFTQSGGSASGTLRIRLAATAGVSGSYNSQNIVLSSTGATNVNITTASSGNTVSAKGLIITGLSASNKNYDGATTVSISGTAAYSGLVNSESFTPSDVVTWAFPDANVGSNKTLTRTGSYTAPTTNYSITQPSLTASINTIVPTAPTITGITPGNNQLSVAFTAPSSNGGASISNYEYSTNGGTNWTTPSPAVTSNPLVITALTNGVTYNIQIRAVNSAGSGAASSTTQGTPAAPSSPTISGAATATAFTTTYGTVSTPQSFSITGSTLTNDITATAPTGFEVSNDNSTFGSTATFIQSGGSASGTLYIRLAATAAVSSSYNSQNISLTSTGASTVNIATAASGNTVTAKGLTITGISISNKTYDGNTTATISGTAAYSGLVNGESFSVTDTPSATFIDKNVGNGKSVSVAGYTAPSANYSITQPTALTANITVKELTITSAAVTPKTYDGTNTATITGSLSGVVLGDAVTLNGTGTFASVNVGTGISVTSTSSLSGGDAGNYTLTQPTGLSGDITGASQTITFASLTPATLSTADYSPGATASSGLTVSYSSSNSCVATIVGGNIHIVGAGTTTITASQSGGGNYSAASSVNQTLTVMNPTSTLAAGDVAIVGINSATPDMFSMVFLKEVAANTAFNFTDNGFTASTTTRTGEGFLTYTVPSGGHAAGTVITWTNGMTIAGTGWSSNNPSSFAFNGSGDQLFIFTGSTANWSTLSGITLLYGLNYGIVLSGTSNASNTVQPSTSLLPSTSWLNLGSATYANTYFSNATTSNSTVSVSGTASTLLSYLIDGTNKWFGNSGTAATFPTYTITVSPSPTINSSGTLSAVNTTYGTASSTPTSFSLSANNLSTDLTVTAPSGFEISNGSGYNTTLTISPDGCGKISSTTIYVRLAATTSVGTYSGNIVLSSTGATSVNVATVSSTVSAKSLTITGLSAADKTYDGLTTVSVSGTPSYSGLVNGESFSVTGTVTWAFPNATVENIKTLTRTGNFNAPSGNYTVTQPTLTASITSRSLTLTANNVNKPFGATITGGSGSTAFTSSGLQNGETIGSVTITYGNGAGASDAVGTYSGQVTQSAATGGSYTASNYSISYVAGDIIVSDVPTLDAVILNSALNSTYGTASTGVSFTASGSSLSANITATAQSGYEVSSDNSIFSSSVTVSSGATVYVRFSANLAASSYNNATSVVLTSTGATSANVTTSSSGNTVSVKGLTIAGILISNKTFDGNTTATISGTAGYSGLVNGESFSVSGTPSATFSDKNVGNNKTITVVGYTSPSSNYSLTQPSGLLANITTATLTLTSAAVSSKVYDGTTLATIIGTLSGVISPDVVTMVGTGTFASANVGTGINVTSNSTLNGIDAGNYSLTQPAGLTGEITKANQTITFGALANKTTADVPFNLSATASSGLAVTYSSSNTSVATVNGNTLTIVGAGTTTITASQSGDANFNSAIDVAQSQTITIADIEEIVFPQYIQGLNGTNSNRIPSAYYLKINNLNPNTTYRFYCGFVTSSDLSTSSGAGNNIYVNYSGGSFTRSSSPSLSTANNYGTLTTNSNGSFTGWFVMEPTGNATRFVPGTNLFLRVTLNDGNNGTTATNYRTTINSTKVINLVSSPGANNGTGLYGTSSASAKNFAVLYDNINGIGRPVSASFIEDDGTANTTANSYSSFYNTNVNGVSGAYGVVIPNTNANGIKRIEFKKTSDNSLIYAVTDNDGNWSGSANTVNPTGGTTSISIPNTTFDDATFNEITGVSLLQNTKINGTLTLSQGTLTVGPYELTLNNNIVRTTGLIDASNSSATVIFSGASAQSIPASTFTGNINNLTLSNSAGLSISQDLFVVGALTLTSGKLTLGTNHLTLGETATTSGTFSSNNMIIATGLGELRKRFTQGSGDLASFTFPVGNGGGVAEYTPIVLDFASGNYGSSAYVSVRVQDSKQGTLNSSVTNYLNRNWIVEPNDITGFSYKIQLYYVDADFVTDGSMAEGDLKPIKISSGQWYQPTDGSFTNAVSQGSAGVFANSNYLEWSGLTTFSEFGGASGSNLPLPVELLSFTAECAKETIILKWQTASEFNSAYFEIQKSLDGITWNTIGNQTAAGNSNELLSYSFEDASKTANTTYYRLNQVDNDGLQKYYGPISPLCEFLNHLNGKTIPNPSNDEFWLQISSNEQQKFTYVLQDVNGSKIMENSADLLPGSNLFPIRETIPSGMYFIVIQTENGQQQVIKHIRN